jgi:hypothetical protein
LLAAKKICQQNNTDIDALLKHCPNFLLSAEKAVIISILKAK